jgi:type I restriction enzyme R subunit
MTIEKTFEALLRIMDEMDDEESRAVREGLDEESLAVFDLLRKPNLTSGDIKRIKAVALTCWKRSRRKNCGSITGATRNPPGTQSD